MTVERSAEGRESEFADEISHDSKEEKSIDVENPPSKRPKKRMGMYGIVMQMQEIVYVIQKTRHSFLRPLLCSSVFCY